MGIPEIVFKEAIINALAHRYYYDKGGRITIEVFPDRVEISNPGGLVSAISPKDFGTRSHSRNPLIFGLFERIHMVEQVGSGISRIKDELRKRELPLPEFRLEGIFSVIIKRPVYSEKGREKTRGITRGITRENILELIKHNNRITIPEMAEELDLTIKGVEYQLRKLRTENKIRRVGSTVGGHWEIL